MMKLLLHACCAPCSLQCVEALREEGVRPVLFWQNPNIHPFTEYRSRREALRGYAAQEGLELVLHGEYGLRPFLEEVRPHLQDGGRCAICYRIRLREAAAYAAGRGYARYSTTLLISPYQNHTLLRTIGEQEGARYGVEFLYRDFRPRFREGQRQAREAGLYMQKYCGCIFSEEERYSSKK